jgi:hypothetical protein
MMKANQSLQPTANRRPSRCAHFIFMKQFIEFATLAPATGG